MHLFLQSRSAINAEGHAQVADQAVQQGITLATPFSSLIYQRASPCVLHSLRFYTDRSSARIQVRVCESRETSHNRKAAHLSLMEQVRSGPFFLYRDAALEDALGRAQVDRKLRGAESVVEVDRRRSAEIATAQRLATKRRHLFKKLLRSMMDGEEALTEEEATKRAWKEVERALPRPTEATGGTAEDSAAVK